jgi:uncharacterized protein YggT (Ycf19 family)
MANIDQEFINNLDFLNSSGHSLSFYLTQFTDSYKNFTFFLSGDVFDVLDKNEIKTKEIEEIISFNQNNTLSTLLSNFLKIVENIVLSYPETKLLIHFFHFGFICFLNCLGYFYILIKFYRVLCYAKMTFEWLPMVNPYEWPISLFVSIAEPYFFYWEKLLPALKTADSSFEISTIIALEALNVAGVIILKITNLTVLTIEEFEKLLDL